MRGKNKEKILNAGYELFYQKGIEMTGVQEIATASGVPKGSFYNYFHSKSDFAVCIIELYQERQSKNLEETLLKSSGSHLAVIKEYFEYLANLDVKHALKGCLVGNISQEQANHDEAIRIALNDCIGNLEKYYIKAITLAQENGEISKDLNPEDTACFLYNGWQGALLRAKVTKNDKPLRQFIDLVFGTILI